MIRAVQDQAGGPRRASLARRLAAGTAIALAVAGGLAWLPGAATSRAVDAGAAFPEVRASERAVPTVSTALAERGAVPVVVPASGSLAARREVSVGVEVSGLRVAAVLAEVGESVAAGQPLVRFDTDLLERQLAQNAAGVAKARAALAQAEAALPEADAALRVARADFERAEALRGTNAVSGQVFDQRRGALDQAGGRLGAARAAVAVAAADLAVAEAAVAETRARIEKSTILAPVAGVLARRSVETGAVLTQFTTEPLMRIVEGGAVELAAEVPDIDLARLRPGLPARVTLADGAVLDGRVRLVAPTVDAKSRLGTVFVALPHDARLRCGAYARAEIVADTAEAVTVPAAAVEVRDGAATALVVDGDGRARRRALTLGAGTEGRVAVARGLRAGERVVLGAAGFVREGDPVRVATAEAGEP